MIEILIVMVLCWKYQCSWIGTECKEEVGRIRPVLVANGLEGGCGMCRFRTAYVVVHVNY